MDFNRRRGKRFKRTLCPDLLLLYFAHTIYWIIKLFPEKYHRWAPVLCSFGILTTVDYQALAVNTKGRDATSIVSDLDGNLSSILQNIQAIKIPSIGNSIRIRMFSTGDPGFLFSRVPTENYTDEVAMLLLKWGIPLLLANMSLKNLLQVLGCLLVEMRVVVICGRLELLSATVMCLASLLRPLIWAGPLITILPPSLREYIEVC